MRWSRRVLAGLAVTGLAAVELTGCGASARAPQTVSTASASPHPTAPAPSSSVHTSPATRILATPSTLPVAPGAGTQPQTRIRPSTGSVAFRDAMSDLWLAVTTGNPRLALPAFFPLTAYQQVKAIADPAADWHHRLWGDFVLDVGAAHHLVGSGARLVRVIVPVDDAAWVYPGACDNRLGYWHVPGARVVYEQDGRQRSFGIASLISWRGVWYVVHFGAVLRDVTAGIVDQPATGPGVPGPPGGC